MLSTLILWIYILGTAYLFGMAGMHLLGFLFRKEIEAAPVSTPLVLLLGLCLVNSLAALLSLFLRLGWLTQALFFLSNVGLAWWLWKKNALLPTLKLRSISWMVITLFVVIFLTVLLISSNFSSNPDTGIYHAQAIRWMETYPAVPGLGNLHSRFAYNSQWLVLNAFFSFSFLGLQSFHVLPGALTLVVIAWFLEGVNHLLEGKRTVANTIKLLLIPVLFYTIGSEISSPGTDFPTALLIWVILPLWLDVLERKSQQAGTGMDELLVFFPMPVRGDGKTIRRAPAADRPGGFDFLGPKKPDRVCEALPAGFGHPAAVVRPQPGAVRILGLPAAVNQLSQPGFRLENPVAKCHRG